MKAFVSVSMSITPVLSVELIDFIFIALDFVLLYFAVLCFTITTRYAFDNFKQSFVYGVRRFTKIIPVVLIIVLLLLIFHLIASVPFIAQFRFIMILLAPLLLLPIIAYSRILLFRTAQEYWPTRKAKKNTSSQKEFSMRFFMRETSIDTS